MLRRALRYQPATVLSALWPKVDQPVSAADHVHVVLDDDDRVAEIGEPMQHVQELLHVVKVQSGRRFVEQVERTSCLALRKFAREFNALKFLVQNAERVISRDELLTEVWGYQNYPSTRTVDNHILKIRQKLEKDPANPVHFRTVHGVGYKFVR